LATIAPSLMTLESSRPDWIWMARTFAELWVHPARLTAEISGFLDRVWAAAGPQNRGEAS
jgi:hypothetical protein